MICYLHLRFYFIVVWKNCFVRSGKSGKLGEFYFTKFVSTLQSLEVQRLFGEGQAVNESSKCYAAP